MVVVVVVGEENMDTQRGGGDLRGRQAVTKPTKMALTTRDIKALAVLFGPSLLTTGLALPAFSVK
jgi:hypothetical protein